MIAVESGLSSAQVAERIAAGQVNHAPDARSRSIGDIVKANTFTWFNGLIGSMWLVMLIIAPIQDSLFGFVIVANMRCPHLVLLNSWTKKRASASWWTLDPRRYAIDLRNWLRRRDHSLMKRFASCARKPSA